MRIFSAALAACALLTSFDSLAQPAPASAPATAPSTQPVVDVRVERAMRAAGELLGKLKAFRVTCEVVSDAGDSPEDMVEQTATVTLDVVRPDKIRSQRSGDGAAREVWYDGTSLTILDRGAGHYSRIKTPETIDKLVDHMAEKYGMSVPLADILVSNFYAGMMGGVQQGRYVGESAVGGANCRHLAFNQESIDWQIWIDAGEHPFPRKLLIIYKTEPGQPRYRVTFGQWDRDVKFSEDHFTFTAAKDLTEIDMQPLDAAAEEAPGAPR